MRAHTQQMRRGPYRFKTDLEVRFAETDAQGVVYNGNYLTYFEVGRVRYVRHVLFDGQRHRIASKGFDWTVAESYVRYRSGARFDELLEVWVRCAHLRRSSFRLEYEIVSADDGRVIATGHTVQVALDQRTGKPTAMPEPLRERLRAYEGADLREG
jgi:acyl-CoA thioester hydrolase